MYMITEVAKLLGVSRQTIYNKIDKLELTKFTDMTDKGKVINEEGFQLLKDNLTSPPNTVNSQPNVVNDSKYVDGLIDSLKSENEHLKGIIAEQSRQISDLTRLVENSQKLQSRQQEKLILLEDTITKEKRSFWDRFKG